MKTFAYHRATDVADAVARLTPDATYLAGGTNLVDLMKVNVQRPGFRSKSWDEFKGVAFEFVITVCDHARESCPVWTGQPVIAHWSSPEPAGVEGSDEEKFRAFVNVASQIAARAELFCAFSDEKLRDAAAVRSVGDQFRLEGEAGMRR